MILQPRSDRVAIIIHPSDPGSLGDEALIAVAVDQLSEFGYCVEELAWSRPRAEGPRSIRRARGPFPLMGWIELRRLRPTLVVFLGADVLNGHYSDWRSARHWNLLSFLACNGIAVAAVGFSWESEANCGRATARAVRAAPPSIRISCRDARSADRFRRQFGRPVLQGADLAFLLQPDETAPKDFGEWYEQIPDGWRVVAVNLNGRVLGSPLQHGLVQEVALRIAALEKDRIAVVLVPHDFRVGQFDVDWAQSVAEAATACGGRFTISVTPDTPSAAKAIASRVDAVVTGRMHFGIAALGGGTPARIFDYQGKVEGLGALFPGVALRVSCAPAAFLEHLDRVVRDVLDSAIRERAAIKESLPAVRGSAMAMLEQAAR